MNRSRSSRVESTRPDPELWRSALDAARSRGIHARHLRYDRATGIVHVINQPKSDPNATMWVQ